MDTGSPSVLRAQGSVPAQCPTPPGSVTFPLTGGAQAVPGLPPAAAGELRHMSELHDLEDHDRGLSYDLTHPRHRRAFLGLVGAGAASVGGAVLLGTAGSATADAV